MILSSFVFQRKIDFVLYFCSHVVIFEENIFSILGCLGFILDGFCSRFLELLALRGWVGSLVSLERGTETQGSGTQIAEFKTQLQNTNFDREG